MWAKQLKFPPLLIAAKKLPPDIDSRSVFCNSELSLSDIDVYGFDYDYTLARYNQSVEKFIHDSAKKILVEDMKVTGKRRKTLLLLGFFLLLRLLKMMMEEIAAASIIAGSTLCTAPVAAAVSAVVSPSIAAIRYCYCWCCCSLQPLLL